MDRVQLQANRVKSVTYELYSLRVLNDMEVFSSIAIPGNRSSIQIYIEIYKIVNLYVLDTVA